MLPALFVRGRWAKVRNRDEHLPYREGGVDTSPLGLWSKDIHACHVFPSLGRRLMKMALAQWPVDFSERPVTQGAPAVSFVIPHRGRERLQLLQTVVRSIIAQAGPAVECIVVEQGPVQEVDSLPEGVKYIHLPHPEDPDGWRKAWAFNVGVDAATADIVVCHDGDIIMPKAYASEIVKRFKQSDLDVLYLYRFLFCLSKEDTFDMVSNGDFNLATTPERVRQNWQGGTVAIRKRSFMKVGGYDEAYVGWGGEDNEFFDRCWTLNAWRFGYLPFVHLWHPPQSGSQKRDRNPNLVRLEESLKKDRSDRIADVIAAGYVDQAKQLISRRI